MITYVHLHLAYWFDEFRGPNVVDQDMVGIRLRFVQNTHIFHYMTQKSNYETNVKDVNLLWL
jgi:hypothetical protein